MMNHSYMHRMHFTKVVLRETLGQQTQLPVKNRKLSRRESKAIPQRRDTHTRPKRKESKIRGTLPIFPLVHVIPKIHILRGKLIPIGRRNSIPSPIPDTRGFIGAVVYISPISCLPPRYRNSDNLRLRIGVPSPRWVSASYAYVTRNSYVRISLGDSFAPVFEEKNPWDLVVCFY